MSVRDRVQRVLAGFFLPQVEISPPRSPFENDPDRIRKERPLQTYTKTRWLQKDIEDALRAADGGNLEMAARLSRSLRRDGVLGGILSTRTGGLMRLPKIFRGDDRVVSALETNDDPGLFDRLFPPKELALLAGDGILLGVGVGELVPTPGRPFPTFVRLDPEFLKYRWSEDAWYYHAYGGPLKIEPGDGRWILHTPGGYQQPWAHGLWASLAKSFISKDHAFHHRENYSTTLANPARVAVSPQGASEGQTQAWFQKVMAWRANSVFGMRPGYDVRLLESNGRGYEVFQQTIDSSDKEFMVGLAGQIVTITGGAGFANADIHATIRTDLIQDDGDGVAVTVNEQGLRHWVNYLFGSGARGSVSWDTRPPADLKVEADAMTSAAQAIVALSDALRPYGLKVDAREMAARFKLAVLEVSGLSDVPAAGALPAASASPATPAGQVSEDSDDAEPNAAAALAEKMTEHGVARCEHGSMNRCRLCGIERVRDFDPGIDGGEHTWRVAWQPIAAAAVRAAPEVKPIEGSYLEDVHVAKKAIDAAQRATAKARKTKKASDHKKAAVAHSAAANLAEQAAEKHPDPRARDLLKSHAEYHRKQASEHEDRSRDPDAIRRDEAGRFA